jgi:putative inorganic carbon (hco3(-)) transporter
MDFGFRHKILKIKSKPIVWFYGLSIIFALFNGIALTKGFSYSFLLPFLFAVILLAIFDLSKLIFFTVFCVPLSIPLREIIPGLSFDMNLPSEPLLFGSMLLFFYHFFKDDWQRKIAWRHPLTIAVLVNLGWILFTSLTSSMLMVSLKFSLSRMWFVVCFYFLLLLVFADNQKIRQFLWLYIAGLLFVVAYTFNNHLKVGLFNKHAHYGVMNPLYNDHTAWGAALAMIVPVLVYLAFRQGLKAKFRILNCTVLSIVVFAFVFSYSRAAWLSGAVGLVFAVIMFLRLKWQYLLIFGLAAIVYLGSNIEKFSSQTSKNKSRTSIELSEHVESISNVSTDESNLERLNRWNCALRMFREKPILGWGPGTYMFQYAPFQVSAEKTSISTDFGEVGNAHSEYLGPLAESGILGTLSILTVIIFTLFYAIRLIYNTKEKDTRNLVIALSTALVTYYVHGFLNNFLDTDKLSVLFWGFTAAIVAIDLRKDKYEGKVESNL